MTDDAPVPEGLPAKVDLSAVDTQSLYDEIARRFAGTVLAVVKYEGNGVEGRRVWFTGGLTIAGGLHWYIGRRLETAEQALKAPPSVKD